MSNTKEGPFGRQSNSDEQPTPNPSLVSRVGEGIPGEIESWTELESLPVDGSLLVTTGGAGLGGSVYTIERRSDGFYISGNKTYCPEPTKVVSIGLSGLLMEPGTKRVAYKKTAKGDVLFTSQIASTKRK